MAHAKRRRRPAPKRVSIGGHWRYLGFDSRGHYGFVSHDTYRANRREREVILAVKPGRYPSGLPKPDTESWTYYRREQRYTWKYEWRFTGKTSEASAHNILDSLRGVLSLENFVKVRGQIVVSTGSARKGNKTYTSSTLTSVAGQRRFLNSWWTKNTSGEKVDRLMKRSLLEIYVKEYTPIRLRKAKQ